MISKNAFTPLSRIAAMPSIVGGATAYGESDPSATGKQQLMAVLKGALYGGALGLGGAALGGVAGHHLGGYISKQTAHPEGVQALGAMLGGTAGMTAGTAAGGRLGAYKKPTEKKEAKPTEKKEPEKKAALDPIAQLGFLQGYTSAIMPPEAVFQKLASKTCIDVNLIKAAYIEKKAIGPLGALGIGAGAGIGLPALYQGLRSVLYGYRKPDQVLSPLHRDIANSAMYNQGFSRDLQAIRGAFAPADNPLGKSGSFVKKALMGSMMGGAGLGMLGGAGVGAAAGMAIPALYKMFSGYHKPNQRLSPMHKDIANSTMYNQGFSRDLQAIRGSFAPAANPFGNTIPGVGY